LARARRQQSLFKTNSADASRAAALDKKKQQIRENSRAEKENACGGCVCVLGVAALIRHLKREMFMGCNLFRPAVAKIALALFSAARSRTSSP